MRSLFHPLMLAAIGASCLGMATATAQSGKAARPGDVVLSGGPTAVSQKSSPPPLSLSDEQRTEIKQVLSTKDSEVSFLLKGTKSANSFDAKIGEKLPSGLKGHALPPPLIYKMPVLKRYSYLKFKQQVLIVNPMTHKIVDMFPQS
jgi:hypothetical protein